METYLICLKSSFTFGCIYSQVEKGCLAFIWACERPSDFIWGKSIIGETDHKPFVPMLMTHMLNQLTQAVWWPGLSRQIQGMVESCRTCAKHRINKPEPLCPSPFSERPQKVLGTDMFYSQSVDYLLVVDYSSCSIEVVAFRKNETATKVIRALKAIFPRHGIPEKV